MCTFQVLQVLPREASPEPDLDGPQQECLCSVRSPGEKLRQMPI